MEQEDSAPCSKEPATCFYPEPDRFIPPPSCSLKIHFNIIVLYPLSFPSGLNPSIHQFSPSKEYMYRFSPPVRYIPRISHSSLIDQPTAILWEVQVMKLLVLQSPTFTSQTSRPLSVFYIVPKDVLPTFCTPLWESFHGEELLTIRTTAGRPPSVGCPRLFIQCIRR
jgi:hypothetical protein